MRKLPCEPGIARLIMGIPLRIDVGRFDIQFSQSDEKSKNGIN
mgnify:CR=1 FL=1